MKTLNLFFALVIVLSTTTLNAQERILNTNESSLKWTGKAAYSTYALSGTLNANSGLIKIINDSIVDLKIIITMKSLDHENSDLKRHLKSTDFFDVKKHKQALFSITSPSKIRDGKAELRGEMTIKGVTKVEVINVQIKTLEDRIDLNFEIALDRTTFGIKHNSPSFFKSLKENAIADEFKLKGHLKFE